MYISKYSFKNSANYIFGSGVFTQIRPVWVGDLGTRPKIQNFDGLGGLGLKSAIYTF